MPFEYCGHINSSVLELNNKMKDQLKCNVLYSSRVGGLLTKPVQACSPAQTVLHISELHISICNELHKHFEFWGSKHTQNSVSWQVKLLNKFIGTSLALWEMLYMFIILHYDRLSF